MKGEQGPQGLQGRQGVPGPPGKVSSLWPATVVAVAFLAFLTVILWKVLDNDKTIDFKAVWAALGPIVGVVVGAIPTYFFAQKATVNSEQASKRAEAFAAHIRPEDAPKALQAVLSIQ